jgi:serine/threonine-protein kinase
VGCAYLPKYYHSLQKAYDHRPFLLMDFIPGNTLTEELALRSPTLTLLTKLHLLSHLSNALRFLEEREIVHLDLTPSNVIVSRDLLTKVIDFG